MIYMYIFVFLIVICVLWVVVGIYSTHKERLHEESIDNLERLNKLLEKHKYIYRLDSYSKGVKSMTCREKLKLEHPHYISSVFAGGCKGCPGEYGYREKTVDIHKPGCIHNCDVCWDQPVENTDDKKSIDDVAREAIQGAYGNGPERIRKLMDAGYDPHVVQCRVNELMIEEIDKLHVEDSVNKYEECATEMYALYTEFRRAGFDNDQAFALTQNMLSNAMNNTKE